MRVHARDVGGGRWGKEERLKSELETFETGPSERREAARDDVTVTQGAWD